VYSEGVIKIVTQCLLFRVVRCLYVATFVYKSALAFHIVECVGYLSGYLAGLRFLCVEAIC
jgi:hypothetical protein